MNACDANADSARPSVGVGTSSVIGLPLAVSQAEAALRRIGVLQQIHLLGYNPYPAPGKANDTTVGRGSIGPQDAENKYVVSMQTPDHADA